MGVIYVYEPWPTAVDTLGLCGPLSATECLCTDASNDAFEISISHPIDPNGKWAYLAVDNLVKANVPLHTTPEFDLTNGGYASSLRRMTVKADATFAERCVYASGGSGGIRIAVLPPGQTVYANTTYSYTRTRIRWTDGYGYIAAAALDAAYTDVNIQPMATGVEYVIPPPKSRPQLFRIYSIKKTDDGITAAARHVSYDQLGNLANITGGNVALSAALGGAWTGVLDSRVDLLASREFRSDGGTETRDVAAWTRVSPIEAILAPSNGIAALWGLDVVRDNWGIYLVDGAGTVSKFRIDYGVNLLGIDYSEDVSDVIAQILPVGQTSKGKPLTIPSGTYTVNGVTISVTNGLVESPWGDDYPIPHLGVLDKGSEIKAAGTTSAQLNAAYVKLIQAAQEKFNAERCDLPRISMSVNFFMLRDTAEYAKYDSLERLFNHDTVPIRHSRLGIDVTATVNKTVWDCLGDRYKSMDIGSVRQNLARMRFAPWQIPGLTSLQSSVETISSLI